MKNEDICYRSQNFITVLNISKNLIRLITRVNYYKDREIRNNKFIKWICYITLFHYNVDEKKKINFQWGPLTVWSLHILPMSVWIFSRYSVISSHIPKMLMLGSLACLNCPSLDVDFCLWACPTMVWRPVQGWVSPCTLNCWDRLWPPSTLT